MDRKFVLAFLLSSFVIFGYYALFPPEPAVEETKETAPQEQAASATAVEAAISAAPAEAAALSPEEAAKLALAQAQVLTVDTPKYKALINTANGVVTSLELKNYAYIGPKHVKAKDWLFSIFTGKSPAPPEIPAERRVNMIGDLAAGHEPWLVQLGAETEALVFQTDAANLTLKDQAQTLTLKAVSKTGVVITKTITFFPDTYSMELDLALSNPTAAPINLTPKLVFGSGNDTITVDSYPRPKLAGWLSGEDFESVDPEDLEEPLEINDPQWAVVTSTYFLQGAMAKGDQKFLVHFDAIEGLFQNEKTLIPSMHFQDVAQVLDPNQTYRRGFKLYYGPMVQAEMEAFDVRFPAALNLGWLDFLAHPILALLRWWQSHVINWGLAIILLTITVRTLMFPLAIKGMKSMRKMAQLNPRMKHLREKYKKDKEKLNLEIMNLYRKNKINPLSGCLPLLVQIPIFIALYQALMPAIELRHQAFGWWIDNLSAADHTLILPMLMGATMYLQQHLTPQPNMEPLQQKMMMWMPVLMVFFFLDMPMGLVLYWVASNVFSIFQQLIFNRIKEAEIQH